MSVASFPFSFWQVWHVPGQRSVWKLGTGRFHVCEIRAAELSAVQLYAFQLKYWLRSWSITDQVMLAGLLTQEKSEFPEPWHVLEVSQIQYMNITIFEGVESKLVP